MTTVRQKIVSLKRAVALASHARKRGKIIVTTNGSFDLIHAGHVRNLETARKLGDLLIVGINSDASVRRYKGPKRPINPQKERAEVVAALQCVTHVFIFNDDTPVAWVKKIKPHIHAKGADRTLSQMPEAKVVKEYGGKIVRLPYLKGKSTTNIIERVIAAYAKRSATK